MKLIITESQLKRLKSRLTEQVDNKYSTEVELSFSTYLATYKGNEINYIPPIKAMVYYNIDIDFKPWGIEDISLYGITGPTEVDIDVYYYINDDEDVITLPIRLDWAMINVEEKQSNGQVFIDKEVDVVIDNDSNGNLVVKEIIVKVNK
jgi:hypothetical protein